MNEAGDLLERTVASRRVYSGQILGLRVDTVELADGRRSRREVVEHAGAVVIIPLLDGGEVVLVRQYRQAVGEVLLELPAGGLEPGESGSECARRELAEETGLRAGRMDFLLDFYSSPGFCSERLQLFLARELKAGERDPDLDENLETVRLPLSRALKMVRRGRIRDAKTIIGLREAEQGGG